jgi:predicted Zn-dependent protease
MLRMYLLVLLTGVAFGQDPLASRGVNFYSLAKEAALGAQLAEQIRIEKKMLESAVVEAYVASIGRALAVHLPEYAPGFRLEVFAGPGSLLRTPDALPGGYVFVPTGLLLAAESEPEFAGMLAHSMAHAAARQGTRLATRGQMLKLSSVPLLFMGGTTGSHASQAALAIPLGFLSFMRKNELQADRMAVQAMARSGYDPAALVRYIERMQVASPQESSARSPLPPSDARLSELRQAIAELPPLAYPASTGEYERVREEVRGALQVRPPTLRR